MSKNSKTECSTCGVMTPGVRRGHRAGEWIAMCVLTVLTCGIGGLLTPILLMAAMAPVCHACEAPVKR